MESHTLHMISMKALFLAVLAVTATGCGLKVNDDGDDDAKDGTERSNLSNKHGKNELILITDGAYGAELSSSDVSCQKLVDDQVVEMRFRMPEGSPDAGLAIDLRVAGDFAAGDALTPDNSGKDRFFDFTLKTPAADTYAYTSTGFGDGPEPKYAALTILKSSDYVTSGRIWIEQLALTAAADGSEPVKTLSVRGSFECAAWD